MNHRPSVRIPNQSALTVSVKDQLADFERVKGDLDAVRAELERHQLNRQAAEQRDVDEAAEQYLKGQKGDNQGRHLKDHQQLTAALQRRAEMLDAALTRVHRALIEAVKLTAKNSSRGRKRIRRKPGRRSGRR